MVGLKVQHLADLKDREYPGRRLINASLNMLQVGRQNNAFQGKRDSNQTPSWEELAYPDKRYLETEEKPESKEERRKLNGQIHPYRG